jgi:hypothetical protein
MSAAEDILIQVHLFRATLEDLTQLKQVELLSPSSRSELSSLMDKVKGSEYELTAAAINALLDIYEIDEIQDLFLHEKAWICLLPFVFLLQKGRKGSTTG